MTYLLTTGAEQAFSYPTFAVIVGVVGFIAAAGLGSLAGITPSVRPVGKIKNAPTSCLVLIRNNREPHLFCQVKALTDFSI